jgi:formate hydrogenlyase subunit 6/NADH:ubiquinone oxidoreductase subunit I
MNVFDVLSQNLSHGSRTRTPDASVPYPQGFRGRITHDPALCTACGTCVYACSPSAISVDDRDAWTKRWNYTEDRCTFCGYCVQYCPTHALAFDPVAPAPLTERPQHYLADDIVLKPCPQCGKPVRAVPEVTLQQTYGDPLPAEIAEARGLCEGCRQKAAGRRFFDSVVNK